MDNVYTNAYDIYESIKLEIYEAYDNEEISYDEKEYLLKENENSYISDKYNYYYEGTAKKDGNYTDDEKALLAATGPNGKINRKADVSKHEDTRTPVQKRDDLVNDARKGARVAAADDILKLQSQLRRYTSYDALKDSDPGLAKKVGSKESFEAIKKGDVKYFNRKLDQGEFKNALQAKQLARKAGVKYNGASGSEQKAALSKVFAVIVDNNINAWNAHNKDNPDRLINKKTGGLFGTGIGGKVESKKHLTAKIFGINLKDKFTTEDVAKAMAQKITSKATLDKLLNDRKISGDVYDAALNADIDIAEDVVKEKLKQPAYKTFVESTFDNIYDSIHCNDAYYEYDQDYDYI